jgi:hypothetical protein
MEVSWSRPRRQSAEAESNGAPDGCFPLPARAQGMSAVPVAGSKTAMWEFPTDYFKAYLTEAGSIFYILFYIFLFC